MWMEFEPNNPETGQIHPRFNSWNAEALLRSYAERQEPRWLAAVLANARGNTELMRSDGSYNYDLGGRDTPTGSATAFAGMLWLGLRELGYDEFDDEIHAAARWLVDNRFPVDHADPNLRGLVIERRLKRGEVIQRDLGNFFAARFFEKYLEQFGE